MIGLPLNDYGCLVQITEVVAELVRMPDPILTDLASDLGSTKALFNWIRSLPQRDDTGEPSDGPRAESCAPPQRLRIPAPDPNCVERSALAQVVGEMIDPRPVRQLATVDTPVGRHTFLVENGVPVILDPRVTRNSLEGGLFRMQQGPVQLTPAEAVDWMASIAEEPAMQHPNGLHRVRNGREAMRRVVGGRPIPVRAADDVAFTIALAEREARRFGPRGVALARTTAQAVADLEDERAVRAQRGPRNALPSLRIGRYRISPDVGTLGALARVGGRLGVHVGTEALKLKLASMGISGPVLTEVERELNREGLTLGELAKPPPMPGTLAAVTTDALMGRWLASRAG